ncbi:MAG: hypothetical protein V4678_02750 [Patescibacteria group bacterium]
MGKFGQLIGGGGAAFAAFLLLVGPINWNPAFFGDPSGDPESGETSDPPSGDPSDDPGDEPESDDCSTRRGAIDALTSMGFERGNYVVGASAIDWSVAPSTHTDQAFSSEPLRSKADLWEFLQADTNASRVARELLGPDADPDDNRGEWVAVQFQNPIVYSGNNYWDGTNPVKRGKQMVLAGDVWWLSVETSGCGVNPADSIRAACGNIGFSTLEPAVRRD